MNKLKEKFGKKKYHRRCTLTEGPAKKKVELNKLI